MATERFASVIACVAPLIFVVACVNLNLDQECYFNGSTAELSIDYVWDVSPRFITWYYKAEDYSCRIDVNTCRALPCTNGFPGYRVTVSCNLQTKLFTATVKNISVPVAWGVSFTQIDGNVLGPWFQNLDAEKCGWPEGVSTAVIVVGSILFVLFVICGACCYKKKKTGHWVWVPD